MNSAFTQLLKNCSDRVVGQLSEMNQLMAQLTENSGSKDHISMIATVAVGSFIVYLSLVQHLRYRDINKIRSKYPNPQAALDDIEVAREVNTLTMKMEFPFLAREGIEMALFKTYTIPSISKLLTATGEFKNNCPRRVEDTEILVTELTETYARIQSHLKKHPDTSQSDIDTQWERPEQALKRLNELHGKYNISNDDFLYTLSLFVSEPIAWINKYEWRQLDEIEINALFRVWYDIGKGMHLKDIPDTPEKLLAFKDDYAAKHIRYSPSNWKCAEPTIRVLLSGLPKFLRESAYRFTLRLLPSILDKEDAEAFQLPPESKTLTYLVKSLMDIRAFLLRHLALPRRDLIHRSPFYANKEGRLVPEFFVYKPHIYKDGYVISELGPEKFIKAKKANGCPVTMH